MRILLVTEMLPPDSDGGQEVNALKLTNHLRTRGHDVRVLTTRFRPRFQGDREVPPHVLRFLEHGPTLEQVEARQAILKRSLDYLREVVIHKRNARVAEEVVKEWRPDLAYVFGVSRIGLTLALPLEQAGIPILWHQGGPNLERRLSQRLVLGRLASFFRSLEHEELRISYSYVAYVSHFLCDAGRQYHLPAGVSLGSRLRTVIPRGIDFEFTEPIRERYESRRIIMAGRIAHFKGYHIALQALKILRHEAPDLSWVLDIYGAADDDDVMGGIRGSDYLAQLKEYILQHDLTDWVHFRGGVTREELLKQFEQSAIFVSASDCGEAFANTIIEAGGKGATLVVSDDGSAREVVHDQSTGLVYRPGDAEELAANLYGLLTRPEKCFSFATASTAYLKSKFSIGKIIDETETVMRQVLELHSAPSTR